MYLHLGQSTVIPVREVVGIFDMDNSSTSHRTRRFLRLAEERGQVVNVSDDLPKSFVLCQKRGEPRVYLSQLSSATLLKRAESDTPVGI